jgi:hypothetical protein
MAANDNPRILFLDIETKPAIVYSWGLHDQQHSIDQIIDPGGTICFGARWQGVKKAEFYSDWDHGHDEMVRQAHRLFSEADAIITFNGDRFDIPKLMGEFLLAGLPPPKPVTSIDVYKSIKNKGYISGKLGFVSPHLGNAGKEKHDGFRMWIGVMNGDEKQQRKMKRYCIGDVRELEDLYDRIRPYITNHPKLRHGEVCGACGSDNLQRRGYRKTKAFKVQALQCQDCGSWSQGKREAA